MTRYDYNSDNADAGATELPGYTAAEAAAMFQDFVEERLSREAFIAWLNRYPYIPNEPGTGESREVEDEINRATLTMRALLEGERDWGQVREEIMDARTRLSGYAFQSGEVPRTGSKRDPAGHPIDRSFP